MKLSLPIKSLFGHISYLAQNQPMSIALLEADKEGNILRTISYKKLEDRIKDTAFWLMQNGLKDKDVLAIAMPSSPDFLILSWACWSVGIITMPLDIKRDTIDEHKFKIAASKAKLIITKEGIFTKEDKLHLSKHKLVEIDHLDFKNIDKNSLKILWKDNLNYQALILFTSGTTSHPKGAKLSLKSLIVNAFSVKEWFDISKDDRFMVVLPLHHINSTTFCLSTLASGGSICLVPGYSNSRFWQELGKTSSTFTSIVPSICFDQLSRIKEFQAFQKKLVVNRIQIGSAPVVVSDVKEFMNLFDISLYQGYGQTETALRVTGVPLNLDRKTYKSLVDSNSIGHSMDWADIAIMDSRGNILKENEEGELVVKGEAVMDGYIGREQAFRKGYFLTGDIGYYKMINNDRYFFLKGRKKEIIIKGGINISPVAIENKLKEFFEDIDQVFVIGVADRRYGEEIAAVICWKKQASEKAKAYIKYTLAKGIPTISQYETPKFIATIDPKNLPITSTGKVQRSLIKNAISKEQLEPVGLVAKTSKSNFILLTKDSLMIKEAFNLYNYCWDPLALDLHKFKDLINNSSTILALDKENKVQGLVTVLRLSASDETLSSFTYVTLVSQKEKNIIDNNGNSLVCVSICGPNYRKEPIPHVSRVPKLEEVKEYLLSHKDSVYNFHAKAKGGFDKGVSLIKIIPNGRPEDKRALGYNMLLKYPKIDRKIRLKEAASIATQLIEAVMLVAKQLEIENVYAFSRPADAAKYFSRN